MCGGLPNESDGLDRATALRQCFIFDFDLYAWVVHSDRMTNDHSGAAGIRLAGGDFMVVGLIDGGGATGEDRFMADGGTFQGYPR